MIIQCEKLNKYFLNLFNLPSPIIELYNENGKNYMAFNYNNCYYIRISLDIEEYEVHEDIILNSKDSEILIKICGLWPKAFVNIQSNQFDLIMKESVIREVSVDVNYVYDLQKEQRMIVPDYILTHEVNVKSFAKLLDLCSNNEENVVIRTQGNRLLISNEKENLISSLDCNVLSLYSTSLKLSNQVIKLVLNFLNKLTSISCKLTINKDSAFIIFIGSYELFFIH